MTIPRVTSRRFRALAPLLALALAGLAQASAADLPPPIGPDTPRVATIEDEGHYRQAWFNVSFLDLREDFSEAKAAGLRFAVIFEQQGCIYCRRMHLDVLSRKYINDYVRENFRITQLDLWGAREVTDFDGARMSEKALAERWGVIFTPTVLFLKDDLGGLEGRWGRAGGHRAPAAGVRRRHLLRPVRVGAPQALRAGQEFPALPYRPGGRAQRAASQSPSQGALSSVSLSAQCNRARMRERARGFVATSCHAAGL